MSYAGIVAWGFWAVGGIFGKYLIRFVRLLRFGRDRKPANRETGRAGSPAISIAQQELEGLTVTASTIADLHRAARGESDTDEVIRNIYRRVQNASLLRQ